MSWRIYLTVGLLGLVAPASLFAHPPDDSYAGHRGPTYEFTPSGEVDENQKRMLVRIVDETGAETPARISLVVDGRRYAPAAVNRHGLRFVSIHTSKKQKAAFVYSRGTGVVALPLPNDAKQVELIVVKGYEYRPFREPFAASADSKPITVRLSRWSNMSERGWAPADEHLHYDRLDPKHDIDWLTMLAGDGLTHGYFMVLKGGNLPGVWATQYAYGKAGIASDGERWLVPGEEFRDRRQGHINLLGLGEVIKPISTGGIGAPPHPFNFPPLHDVFHQSRRTGGVGGPAHGGAYAPASTHIVDTVLGAAEFFEVANTHLYHPDDWYRLMNCGFILPPAAGTDLPNFPFRDDWQPMFGETRMFVRVGEKRDFESWKAAIRRGEVFVTSGPMIQLTVNGVGPGGVVRLPAGGGLVDVVAEMSSTQPFGKFDVIRNAKQLPLDQDRDETQGVYRRKLRGRIMIRDSCWLAARGVGAAKTQLKAKTGISQNAFAHTAAVKVFVGEEPIQSSVDAKSLIRDLVAGQELLRDKGKFKKAEHRARLLKLYDDAIESLQE